MTQAPLFPPDFTAVKEQTKQALEQVAENADEDWKMHALQAVEITCLNHAEFISDDIWSTGKLESTREDRALGPILLHAKQLGWCEKTGRLRPSIRSHLSGKPVWRSLITKVSIDQRKG